MNLFERLREERERLGFSQTAFAAMADASKHAQINWEKGIASPNAVALAAWASEGLDVLYVVTGDRSFVPPKKLTSEEETMLDYFSQASKEARKAALRVLLAAESSGTQGAPNSAPAFTIGHISGNKSQITSGDITNHGPISFGVSQPKPKKSSK